MKKITSSLLLLVIAVGLYSCSTSRLAGNTENSLNGMWQLEKVTTEGISGNFSAKVFDEQNFDCFVGSNWNFRKSNNSGSYTIAKNGGECVSVKRNFRWSIYDAKDGSPLQLQFKKLDDNMKEILNDTGYRLTILQNTNNMLQVRSDITFEGRPAAFIYTYTRI